MNAEEVSPRHKGWEIGSLGARSGNRCVAHQRVVGEHLEAECNGLMPKRLTDLAVTDDSEGLPGDSIERTALNQAPVVVPDGTVVAANVAGESEGHGQGVLGDLIDTVGRDVGHRNTAPSRLADGDVVDTDPVSADDLEPFPRVDDAIGDLCEAGQDGVGVDNELEQLVFVSGLGHHQFGVGPAQNGCFWFQ